MPIRSNCPSVWLFTWKLGAARHLCSRYIRLLTAPKCWWARVLRGLSLWSACWSLVNYSIQQKVYPSFTSDLGQTSPQAHRHYLKAIFCAITLYYQSKSQLTPTQQCPSAGLSAAYLVPGHYLSLARDLKIRCRWGDRSKIQALVNVS